MRENVLDSLGKAAKQASYKLAKLNGAEKNALLHDLAKALIDNSAAIWAANQCDLEVAEKAGVSRAMLDRLTLNPKRIEGLAADVLAVSALPDPVGEIIDGYPCAQGLELVRKRVPLGVIAVIYEARPNVTMDVVSLCLKTSNAVILRGGKETRQTNAALLEVIHGALKKHQLPASVVQAITDPDRSLVSSLLRLDAYVDMLIPRGGSSLQQLCKEESRIPVILGGIGVCHIFVDESAKIEQSLQVIENAKVQRPSVCNSVETLLLHKNMAERFIPRLLERLAPLGVSFHVTKAAKPYFLNRETAPITPVTEEELRNEWLTLDLNVHVVEDLEGAMAHIREYGSGHSESILTEDMSNADLFVNQTDAAAVYVNASTRFTDGGQFMLGAEVAVSTQKLHARGPMGLKDLTTYKWIGRGQYSVRK